MRYQPGKNSLTDMAKTCHYEGYRCSGGGEFAGPKDALGP